MNNKLNELMAEVMGWQLVKHGEMFNQVIREADCYVKDDKFIMWRFRWNPTEDMNQAMMCADEMRLDMNISKGGRKWWADIEDIYFSPVVSITEFPKAICECIAEAIGGER